jgi:hypothetical protein
VIPWKIAWVVLGGVVTLAAGVVPTLFEVPAYAVIPGIALVGALVTVGASLFLPLPDMFRPLPDESKQFIYRCIVAAIFLHVSWVVALALSPSWLLWWPLGVLVLGVTEWGWCEAHEYILARKPEKPEQSTTAEGRPLDDIETDMAEALKLAGHRHVMVQDWEPIVDESGIPFGTTFRVQLPISRGGAGK